MEEILQHAVVKRGLIIAYYFSNIWYRKGLFGERTIPDPNDTDPIEHPEPAIDETDPEEEENINYTHKNPQTRSSISPGKKSTASWDENVENRAISKKTD
ncbi:hypothetical protein I6I99_12820 [Sphingobacterium multivorum]|uniref:Uncharacterized protein n=1 Tax=Sphingobacterium multivorum TaxID=28454 RepID=A0ABX7CUD5_SPHMU|nr:hypothetical protein [Sphingobacterium multivorum]QQT33390.1 hypothetical protein I6I99_12820 [Sphingobacterium multivorum]QQT55677.1 hypothetical protein I6I98_10625 [Sphingobacterium multivorum]